MPSYTDDQFARLPKWAQHEIRQLTDRVADLTTKLGDGPADSNTFADNYVRDARTPLGEGALITFHLGQTEDRHGPDTVQARVVTLGDKRRLEVRCVEGALVIRPSVANTVHVEAPGGW